ncbi:MAG: flagellar export chaperone FlgN [Candidatus Kapabacteria bacterium]|nr:flagellar export chaperone FlgN [Candidatus Kapabacteria bacterium]MBX7156509.1 flagellar protein FlgN [Bacteroidota bacterium]
MENPKLFGELLALLQTEWEILEHVVDLSEHQQQALVRFESDRIEVIAQEQERLSKQMHECENKRFEIISMALGISNKEARALTLSELIQHVEPQFADSLVNIRQKMSVLVTKLQFLNTVNRVLALRGRNSVRNTLDYIRNERMHVVNTSL